MQMGTDAKVTRVIDATAAGTTVINGASVDMANFEGVQFTASIGALTATQTTSMKLQHSSDDGGSDPWADMAGSQTADMADGDSDKCIVIDCYRPRKQFVRPVINRGVAAAVVDGCVANQYAARKGPTVNDAASVQATNMLTSPDTGIA